MRKQKRKPKVRRQKRKPKVRRQSGNLKVSSFHSLGFFFCCGFLFCLRKRRWHKNMLLFSSMVVF
jgi:hypothetical protein